MIQILATNAVLLYNNYQKSEEIDQVTNDYQEEQKLNGELEKLHFAAEEEISQLTANNEDLKKDAEEMLAKFNKSKSRIQALLSGSKKTKKELAAIQSLVDELRVEKDQYLAELTALKNENMMLADANTQLTEEKQNLSTQIVEERKMNDELTTARATLISEKEDLTTKNADLSATVVRASVIEVANLDVTGFKVKKSGKSRKARFARNIDRLKICFTPQSNEVANNGEENFHIRIISPQGETLASESMGSGIFKTTANQEEVRYTHIKVVDYKNGASAPRPKPTSKGVYTLEIFNKGYLTGTSTFKLK